MTQPLMAPANPVTEKYVGSYLERIVGVLKAIDLKQVAAVGKLLYDAREEGRQVFLMGNGGSAALASHLAVDFGKGCSRKRPKRFKVLSLTDNVPWLTAIGNDLSYEDVFVEQLENYARKGDVVIAISGSGNSRNVLKAIEFANRTGCETVGLAGYQGGKLKPLVKHYVHIPAEHMGLIEDGHLVVGHILLYGFMDAEFCG